MSSIGGHSDSTSAAVAVGHMPSSCRRRSPCSCPHALSCAARTFKVIRSRLAGCMSTAAKGLGAIPARVATVSDAAAILFQVCISCLGRRSLVATAAHQRSLARHVA